MRCEPACWLLGLPLLGEWGAGSPRRTECLVSTYLRCQIQFMIVTINMSLRFHKLNMVSEVVGKSYMNREVASN